MLLRHPFRTAVILCVVLIGLIEGVSYLILNLGGRGKAPVATDSDLMKLYPKHSLEDIKATLRESWAGVGFQYKPFVEYEMRPMTGRFVNVQREGYRSSTPLPWPAETNAVFLFGGSTTFGAGVQDSETIGQYLSEKVRRPVYNFAVPAYYSTPERVKFFSLVTEGHITSSAVFIDGLNDFIFFDVPDRSKASNRLQFALDGGVAYVMLRLLSQANMVQLLAHSHNSRMILVRQRKGAPEQIHQAAVRLIRNRKIIDSYCRKQAVSCLFVTQPVPTVNYDNSKRPVAVHGDFWRRKLCRRVCPPTEVL